MTTTTTIFDTVAVEVDYRAGRVRNQWASARRRRRARRYDEDSRVIRRVAERTWIG